MDRSRRFRADIGHSAIGHKSQNIFSHHWLDSNPGRTQISFKGRYTRHLRPSGMVNVSIFPSLAIGEPVGKAGPDLFRSPMRGALMRDFRDAKTMAHALREALKSKAVETTHSECLELIAKAFGNDNWNVLSAKIEATDTFTPSPKGVGDPAAQTTVFCTFCHKPQHDVRVLIAGPSSTYICDECVDVCDDVVGHNDDQVTLELFKVDEESENQNYPAVYELLRGKSTEAVLSYVDRGRKGAERHRFVLQHVRRKLEMGESEDPTKEGNLTVLRFAVGKTKEELLVIQQQAAGMLQRYEAGLRIATTVLRVRFKTCSRITELS
jgi:hypothetical protein